MMSLSKLLLLSVYLSCSSQLSVLACGHSHHASRSTEHYVAQHISHKHAIMGKQDGCTHDKNSQDRQKGPMTTSSSRSATRKLSDAAMQPSAIIDAYSQSATPAPVRLNVEYQRMSSLTSSQQSTLKAVTSTMLSVLGNYLSVRAPISGSLLVPRVNNSDASCGSVYPNWPTQNSPNINASCATCGQATVQMKHILDSNSCSDTNSVPCISYAGSATGVATDMYMYVTAIQDDACNQGAAAWALPCMFHPVTNRPILGTTNVCPYALSGADQDTLVAVMTHEVLHALGFTDSMFQIFIDPSTNQELALSSITKTATVAGAQVTRVTTPTVVREARAQFGCNTLDGAQLEDEGGDGSRLKHWEYSHYQGEIMTSTTAFAASGEPPRLSRMTLALLEDSGWYLANWTATGGALQWARNTGCTLPTQGCQSYMSTTAAAQQTLFCDPTATSTTTTIRYTVTPSYRSVGNCRSDSFANTCGLVKARGGVPSCTSSNYQYADADMYGWINGATSRAYPVTYLFKVSDGTPTGYLYFPVNGNQGDRDAVCFPSACVNNQLYLNIRGKSIRCPAGQYVDLAASLSGTYLSGQVGPCPDETAVCKTLNCGSSGCNSAGGWCYDGRCICKLGYTGGDCSYSILRGAVVPEPVSNVPIAPAPPPPPAPAVQNVTNWYQLIKFSCQLSGYSLSSFQSRSSDYITAIAGWADIPETLIALANVTESSTPSVAAAIMMHSASIVAESVTAEGDVAVSAADDVVHGLLIRRRKLAGSSDIAAPSLVVSCTIRPTSLAQTSTLMDQLTQTSGKASLVVYMEGAGFLVNQASISSQLTIEKEIIQVPVMTSAAINQGDQSQAAASDSSSYSALLGTLIFKIALATAGCVLVVIAVIIVHTWRRNKQFKKDLEEKEQLEERKREQEKQMKEQMKAYAHHQRHASGGPSNLSKGGANPSSPLANPSYTIPAGYVVQQQQVPQQQQHWAADPYADAYYTAVHTPPYPYYQHPATGQHYYQ